MAEQKSVQGFGSSLMTRRPQKDTRMITCSRAPPELVPSLLPQQREAATRAAILLLKADSQSYEIVLAAARLFASGGSSTCTRVLAAP